MAAIFISHRNADAVLAERLGADLRATGHEVWLDAWEVSLGDSIVEKISSGLSTTTHVVLCFSSSGSASPWMGREWMSALARQLNGEGIRLLPVRLTGGTPPPILADIKYADLTSDWAGGLVTLCAALR
ncbi:toll/interleukin-1 receptor domain-containing protein [Amycolatopsis sp. NPDC021455]|uniref:toll/interleukin-1 receptor domain-containing protein n=1 Tax=Amycolatopsis sp. NPDC021455 TaxID=3154901 RepID=UPI00340C5452